ncbi:MAG: Cys-tRNA(Pro) deacylase [Chlorobi bacterium]|nr:Cys-tRNA(Pro) deacylase [Chlorobiota bacterium]
MPKTNAVRILESKRIEFDLIEYEFDDDELDALSVAKKIPANPETVFKTLVARGDKSGINVFVVPGNFELNLKKAAAASGNKKAELIKVKELLPLTGYVRGGCSPVGMKKNFPVFIDETAQLFEKIYVSAGVRGMQIFISPSDLQNICGGEFYDLI